MSVINSKQGAIKQSEVAVDEALSTIQTVQNQDALTVVKQLQSLIADGINKGSYLLMSEGRITWTGSEIQFDAEGTLNDIIVKIIQNQVESDSFSVDLKLVADNANGEDRFNSITLNDNEVLYIEIDRPNLLSSGGSLELRNSTGPGPSIIPGLTVKKALFTPTSGLPKITASIDGNTTPSLYIPLAYSKTYTVGATTFNDIWWIPHGIRWPKSTTSTLGAVIVEGVETYPNKFVDSYLELQSAMADLSTAGGGVVLLTGNFSIDGNQIIPDRVMMLSRGEVELSFINGGKLICNNGTTLKNFRINAAPGFNNAAVSFVGNRNEISNVEFDFSVASDDINTKGVEITGDFNRIGRCLMQGFNASSRIGIDYLPGSENSYDIDTEWS